MPGENDVFALGEGTGGNPDAVGGGGFGGSDGGMAGQGTVSGAAGEGGVAEGGAPQGGAPDGGNADGGTAEAGAGGVVEGGAGAGGEPSANGGSSGDAGAGEGGEPAIGGAGGSGGAEVVTGLVAHYPFEDLESETQATNEVDPSKPGIYRGTHTHPAGVRGTAVNLRNKAPTTDWVELPAGLFAGLTEVSLSIWLRDLSTARQGGRLFDFSGAAGEQIYFSPHESGTFSTSAHWSGTHAGRSFSDLWVVAPLTDKLWHHVAITWSSTTIDLYIDGEPSAQGASGGVTPSDLGATTANYLGRALNDAYFGLYAELDELRIYNRALSPSEVRELFQNP